jgi:hypothetical protein
MTKVELLKEARAILKRVNRAMDNDEEITFEGNGCNASEVAPAAKTFVKLIEKYVKSSK